MVNDRTAAALATRDATAGTAATWDQLLTKYQPDFQQAMPTGRDAVQLVRDALHCLRTTKGLAECSRESILGGLMTVSQLGLRPGVANLGEAWLIPYKIKGTPVAQLVVGYRGFIKLMYNSAKVKLISSGVVHENDPFEFTYSPRHLTHGWPGWDVDRGPVVGYYAKVDLVSGGEQAALWSETEAEAYRQSIMAAPNFRGGPWKDWPEEMKLKQCVRRIVKYVPTALEAEVAQAVDGSVRTDPSPTVRPEDASQVIEGEAVEEDDNPLHGMTEE